MERFLIFNHISDISAIFICLPDVQDEIISYLVIIASPFSVPIAYLQSLSIFCLIGLEIVLLVMVDLDPILKPCLNLPPCLLLVIPVVPTYMWLNNLDMIITVALL